VLALVIDPVLSNKRCRIRLFPVTFSLLERRRLFPPYAHSCVEGVVVLSLHPSVVPPSLDSV